MITGDPFGIGALHGWGAMAFCHCGQPGPTAKYYDELDERAAWLYEAVSKDPAMHGQKTGK